MVGVLVLVDQDVAESLLVVGQDIRKRLEQLDREHQQVVEVHRRGFDHPLLIQPVHVGDLLVIEPVTLLLIALVVDELVLGV